MASWASAAGLGENLGAWAPGWPRRDPSGPLSPYLPGRWASAPVSRDRAALCFLALVCCGAARVNRLGAWAGEDGGGAGGGIPPSSRGAGLGFPGSPWRGWRAFPATAVYICAFCGTWGAGAPAAGSRVTRLGPWPPQWVGPWGFSCLGEDACLRVLGGCSATASHRQLLFCSSSSSPPAAQTQRSRITDAQTPSVFCAWLQRRMERGLARADSHRQSISPAGKLLIMRTRAA